MDSTEKIMTGLLLGAVLSVMALLGTIVTADHTVQRYYLGDQIASDKVYQIRAEKNWFDDPTVARLIDLDDAIIKINQSNATLK